MSDGPTLLVNERDFRIVRVVDGNQLHYVLEVEDGCDALGVERWRAFAINNKHLQQLYGFLIRVVTKEQSDEH